MELGGIVQNLTTLLWVVIFGLPRGQYSSAQMTKELLGIEDWAFWTENSFLKCGKSISILTELKLPYVSLFQLFLAQTTFFFRYFGKIFILTRDIWWSRFGTKWVKVFVQNEVSSWRQYPGAAKMKPVAYFLLSSFINHSAEKKSLLREPLGPQ